MLATGLKLRHDAGQMVDYRDSLAVHLFGDTGPALARMRRTAEAAGCRIVSAEPIGSDAEPAARAVPGAAVLIELEDDRAGEAAIPLLDWAQSEAARGARRAIVSAPPGLIDLIAARASHPDVDHLCDAGEDERLAALARAGRPVPTRVHDTGREDAPLFPLRRRGDEVAGAAMPVDSDGGGEDFDAASIRALIHARRMREHYVRGVQFADPAWDMLLDLMAARLEKIRVSVSSLCIAASVPPTTALRWIKTLTESGVFLRTADPGDGRRVYIELSGETARALGAYFRQVRQHSPVV